MGKWTKQELKNEIEKVMSENNIFELPSRQFLEGIGRSDLFNAITRNGGFIKTANEFGIPRKNYRISKWSLEEIEKELLQYIQVHGLKRMPSKPEMIKNGRNDLGSAITKYKGMKWWSERIGLPLKQSETTTGNKYERVVAEILEQKGNQVQEMTTKHPYDLLVNDNVKVDVKVSSPGHIEGWRCHTFRPSKEFPTCDLYICVALDEKGNIEKIYIIPSKFAHVTTLCIGGESKYNTFINRWDYIETYSTFYNELVLERVF